MTDNIIIPEDIRPYIMPFEIPGMEIEPFPEEDFPPAKEVTKEWLEFAIPLDVYESDSYRLQKAAEFVYNDIKGLIKGSSKGRASTSFVHWSIDLSPEAASFKSSPAQKDRPAPVKITDRTPWIPWRLAAVS